MRAAVVKLKTKFLAGSLILSTLFSLYTTPDNLRFTKGVVTSFNKPWARKCSWVASEAMALKKIERYDMPTRIRRAVEGLDGAV